ncbi:T6SS effector BTH_I2691 family protein [Pseudomonas alkylphenolica]|uniref:T6SS effector BTH_I2691 family protein n=1 Tax=Pseudomonas alkylphenolica TaxID=237609 RepID=UPI00315D0067
MKDWLTEIAEKTYSTEPRSAFVTCKRSVAILPLRYAVIGNAQGPSVQPAQPPANLALSSAQYTVRAIRAGYLYVFTQRLQQDWTCEGAYQTYSSGLCKALWPAPAQRPAYASVPDFGDLVIRIADPEDVLEARLLFTPDLLTPRMLAEIRDDPHLRDTLRKLDIRQLIQTCLFSEHVLDVSVLDERVADLKALSSRPLLATLAEQLFPPPAGFSPLSGVASRLAASSRDAQGFGVVLDDPIGITQELNAWRNQSVEQLDAFMQQTDREGISNQRKHTMAFALENLRVTLAEQAEQRYTAHANSLGVRYTDREYASGNAHMAMASAGSYRSFRNPAEQQHRQQAEIEQARQDSWNNKYASSVDQDRLDAFMAEFDAAAQQADAIKDQRAADHLLWLNSPALLEAFACYDRADSANGLLFEAQLGIAVAGMNSTALGDAQIALWSDSDSISAHNWFWRGLAQNQSTALEQINQLLAQRSDLPGLDDAQQQGLIKALTAIYDKAHALVSVTDINDPPTSIRLSGAVLLLNTFGTCLLQSRPASLLDGAMNMSLALVLKARLGKLGEELQFEKRNAPLSAGARNKVAKAVNKSFSDALTPGAAGGRLEVRVGTTLALLELWNLKLKAEKADKGSREYIELTAAMVAVSAAGLELGAVAVGLAEGSRNRAVSQAGRLLGSQMKLMAGVLAAGASAVGVVFDTKDGITAFQNKNFSLLSIYLLRASAQTGAAVFSTAIGLAAAGPYLERLIQTYGRNNFLHSTYKASSQLALKMAFMLRWCIRINVIIFITTVTIELLLPDALQHYLRHSTFRKDRGNGTPNTEEQELKNLQKAIEATL